MCTVERSNKNPLLAKLYRDFVDSRKRAAWGLRSDEDSLRSDRCPVVTFIKASVAQLSADA
jgi:hypothetical protein